MDRSNKGQQQRIHSEVLQSRNTAEAIQQILRSFARLHAYTRVFLLVGHDFISEILVADKSFYLITIKRQNLKRGKARERIVAVTIWTRGDQKPVRPEKIHLALDPAHDFASQFGVGNFV